jgi:hypothetical protein
VIHFLFQVFVLKDKKGGSNRFLDRNKRLYPNFDDYRMNNQLPKGPMIYPEDGTYCPYHAKKIDNKIVLKLAETPSSSIVARAQAIGGKIVMVGGIALSVCGVVSLFSPTLLTGTVAKVIELGSFIMTGVSVSR